eukprot:tig00000093_g3521.t1
MYGRASAFALAVPRPLASFSGPAPSRDSVRATEQPAATRRKLRSRFLGAAPSTRPAAAPGAARSFSARAEAPQPTPQPPPASPAAAEASAEEHDGAARRSRRRGKGVNTKEAKAAREAEFWALFDELVDAGAVRQEDRVDFGQYKRRAGKVARLRRALALRTRHFAVMLEDPSSPAINLGSIVRNMDCFGVQDLHVAGNLKGFAHGTQFVRITRGAHKYITHKFYDEAVPAPDIIRALREERGYTVLGAVAAPGEGLVEGAGPHSEGPSADLGGRPVALLQEVDFSRRTLFLFGHEARGLSPEAIAACDGLFTIPMRGMVDSLNVATAVAVTLEAAVGAATRRGAVAPEEYALPRPEAAKLLAAWLRTINPFGPE